MGNLPTFSAFLFFEVEVATDNRDFRPERMEISKHGKRQKNAQKAEESEKPSFIVVPRLWAKREGFKVECTIFFAPEEVQSNKCWFGARIFPEWSVKVNSEVPNKSTLSNCTSVSAP